MAETLAVYVRVIRARLQGQLEYRLSFALDCLADVITQATELIAIMVLFSQIHSLGGVDRTGVLLIYALAGTSFAVADLVAGQVAGLPGYLRGGGFDILLIRPMSTLGQILTSDVALRRVGRLAVALAVAGYLLAVTPIDWTPSRVALAMIAPLSGAIIVASIWVVSSAVAFWLVDAQEVTGTLTHGTNLFITYPIAVYPSYLRRLFAFAIPGAFVSYYPALYLLNRADPLGGPPTLSWLAPVIAVVSAVVAGLVWRFATRRYQGTGS